MASPIDRNHVNLVLMRENYRGQLGKAASIYKNGFATMTQNFGPEALGGACSAQLVLSDEPVLYPHVTRPDIMVVMSQEAYNRFAPELKPEGILIIEKDLVRVSDLKGDPKVYAIPAMRIAEELGKRMVLDSVMVRFFWAVTKLLTADAVRKAVADSVPPSFRELILQAFEKGFDYGDTALAGAPPRMGLQELAHSNEQNYTTAFYGFVILSKAKDPCTPVVTLMSRSP